MSKLKNIDLNLLRVFMTIYRTGSITLAAEELELNQSSVSNALNRFKTAVGQPLFVRSGRGIKPTSVATSLYQELNNPINSIEETLLSIEHFDPEKSKRKFVILGPDYIIQVLLEQMKSKLDSLPSSLLFQENIAGEDESLQMLSQEKVELMFDFIPPKEYGFDYECITEERIICIARSDHPRIDNQLTKEQFYQEKHAVVIITRQDKSIFEMLIDEPIQPRKISSQHGSMLSLLAAVRSSDNLAVSLSKYIDLFGPMFGLKSIELPFVTLPVPIYMIWSKKFTSNPAHQWLRKTLKDSI